MWQPITTAPKGQRILLLARFTSDYVRNFPTSPWFTTFTGELRDNGVPWVETVVNEGWFNITGWQPLPEMPVN